MATGGCRRKASCNEVCENGGNVDRPPRRFQWLATLPEVEPQAGRNYGKKWSQFTKWHNGDGDAADVPTGAGPSEGSEGDAAKAKRRRVEPVTPVGNAQAAKACGGPGH